MTELDVAERGNDLREEGSVRRLFGFLKHCSQINKVVVKSGVNKSGVNSNYNPCNHVGILFQD